MPINVPESLTARPNLERVNVFLMETDRANSQDILPLRILILNLMPDKERTETQLLRLLSNSPLQVSVDFIYTETYEAKNVQKSHLEKFYQTFSEIKDQHYDGLIITGAPVEHYEFAEVDYWEELATIIDWSKTHEIGRAHV